MRYLTLIVLLSLVGCGHHLTNKEIIEQVKFCRDNGLKAEVWHDGWIYEPRSVECIVP